MHELMMAEATTGEFDLQGSMKRWWETEREKKNNNH
jgi:hypothetical protein